MTFMDKLLRSSADTEKYQQSEEISENAHVWTPSERDAFFANLGAPRSPEERHPEEQTPNALIPQDPSIKNKEKIKIPHFRLVPQDFVAGKATIGSYVKYGALALFVGISTVSFLTQSALALKDLAFGSNGGSNSKNQTNEIALGKTGKTDALSDTTGGKGNGSANNFDDPEYTARNGERALGSDDGDTSGSSLGEFSNNQNQSKQYIIADISKLQRPTAGAYLAADVLTGEIILEKNEKLIAPIASVSKLMTAVIAKENMDMQKIAIVSRDSYNTYGAQGELALGEKIKLYDLMYPLLIESSNDAAEVIADAYDKGHEAFLAMMNKKAAELGMTDTYYEDPSGLNAKNVSTVRDLLKLGRYIAEKHPDLYSMTRVRQYAILKHTWFNQNRFLNYDTFLGGKNGFIDEAKKTGVSLFDVTLARGGKRQIMIVLLKSDDREGDTVKIINLLKKYGHFVESSSAVSADLN